MGADCGQPRYGLTFRPGKDKTSQTKMLHPCPLSTISPTKFCLKVPQQGSNQEYDLSIPLCSQCFHSSQQSTLGASRLPTKLPPPADFDQQPLYIIVFGYPPDKYTFTAEQFKSLGESTEPDPNTEITNCFRIGYKDPAVAARAVRRNGEVMNGSWMIGVKFADQAQADALLGQLSSRGNGFGNGSNAMNVDEQSPTSSSSTLSNTPSFGTPIKLEPSTSAFRRPGAPAGSKSTPLGFNWSTNISAGGAATTSSPATQPSASNKSMLGQVSDLIFGW